MMIDADDTGRFLSADNKDSANTNNSASRLQETHFEAWVVPRNTSTSASDSPGTYTDKAWSIAFLVNVCVNVIAAVYFRGSVHHAVRTRRRLAGEGVNGGWATFLLVLTAMVLLAWGLAWGAVHSLVSCPNGILQVAYVGFIGVWVFITIGLLHSGLIPAAVVSGVLCALLLVFFLKRQSRIRFGAANLKVAAMVVRAMPGTIRVALLMSVIQVVWSVCSAMAAVGSIAAFSTVVAPDGANYSAAECMDRREYSSAATPPAFVEYCECDSVQVSDSPCEYGKARWVLVCLWLASGSWGVAVLKNVVTATVTGSVASWWFSPADVSPVNGAFYRATHGSFGSLCKAAAAATVVRVLMYAVRRIRLLRCILSRVNSTVGYGLSYAVCFISIYGLSFSEALRRVSELFRQRGLTVVLNDAVVAIGFVLLVVGQTVLYFALVMMVLVVFVNFSFTGMGLWTLIFATLFLAPIVMLFRITIEVVRSSHKAVVVCFVQDPDALRDNHDTQIFDELSEAWRQMQIESPEMTISSGHAHMQIECTEVTSSGPLRAQEIDSPGTSVVSGGGAARGVVQV